MTEPVRGERSSYTYRSESHKKVQDPFQFIMELEAILEQKFHHGDISMPEFIELSKRVKAIQEDYKANQAKDEKVKLEANKALETIFQEINTLGGGGIPGGKGSDTGPLP